MDKTKLLHSFIHYTIILLSKNVQKIVAPHRIDHKSTHFTHKKTLSTTSSLPQPRFGFKVLSFCYRKWRDHYFVYSRANNLGQCHRGSLVHPPPKSTSWVFSCSLGCPPSFPLGIIWKNNTLLCFVASCLTTPPIFSPNDRSPIRRYIG